jgi:hypothetical protein
MFTKERKLVYWIWSSDWGCLFLRDPTEYVSPLLTWGRKQIQLPKRCFLVFRILDDWQSPETQYFWILNFVFYFLSEQTFILIHYSESFCHIRFPVTQHSVCFKQEKGKCFILTIYRCLPRPLRSRNVAPHYIYPYETIEYDIALKNNRVNFAVQDILDYRIYFLQLRIDSVDLQFWYVHKRKGKSQSLLSLDICINHYCEILEYNFLWLPDSNQIYCGYTAEGLSWVHDTPLYSWYGFPVKMFVPKQAILTEVFGTF